MKSMRATVILALVTVGILAVNASAGMWSPAALPDASTPAWTPVYTNDGSEANGTLVPNEYLRIDTMTPRPSDGRYPYHRYDLLNADAAAAGIPMTGADEKVEVKMRVIDQVQSPTSTDPWAGSLLTYSDPGNGHTDLWFVRIGVGQAGVGWPREEIVWYPLDTSVWHTYRLDVNAPARTAKFYIDNVLMGAADGYDYGSNIGRGVRWGHATAQTGSITDWAYVAWGDSVPVPEPTTLGLLLAGLGVALCVRRR